MLGQSRILDEVFYIQTSSFKGMCAASDLPAMSTMENDSIMYRVGTIVGVADDLSAGESAEWDARVLMDMEKIVQIDKS